MSHPLVAAVWEQLGRTDISNILREIIGDHAAQLAVSQVQNGLVADVKPLVRMVFWIKAIFDLQRSYLQGLTSVRECPLSLLPYLLPSETIYSTLMYLIRVKAELLPMTAAGVRDRAQYRYFLAEAVLAGVRLLLLRGESLHAEMRSNLERAMKTAWQHPGLSNEEIYLVNVLLPRAINDIGGSANTSNGQSLLAASGRRLLPSFNSRLYPFPSVPETHITDLLTGLVGNGPDHTSSFWTLFDTSWAAESALIQCHVDSRRILQQQGDSDTTSSNVEEAFVQTGDSRKRLARTILAAAADGQADRPALKILATIILNQTGDGNPPLQTRKVRDAWNQMAGFRDELDCSLSHFVRWLINRRVQLWDCNGELEAVSHEYQRHLTQWLHTSSPAEAERQASEADKAGAVYVVDCPFVHPVPKALLEEQLTKNGSDTDELQTIPELLSIDASCPLCPEGTRIQHARIIEPLEHLSSAIQSGSESGSIISRRSAFGSISGRTASRSSSMSHSTRRSTGFGDSKPSSPSTSMPKMKSSQSLYAMASSLNHLSAPWLDKSQQKQTIKFLSKELKGVKLALPARRASSIRKGLLREQRLSRQPGFCFSSSGKSLFFWGEDSSCISRFDIPMIDGQRPEALRYDVSGVQCVAAGEQRCAVISSVGQHYELLIFGPNGVSAEALVTIDTPGLSLRSNCMAMSRDDRHIAFILENQVHVYEVGNIYDLEARSIRKVTVNECPRWAQEKAAIHRKIAFSVDGNGLVLARLESQSVYFDVWHRDADVWNIAKGGFYSIKNTSIDGSLTGAFYNSLHNSIFLTAFSSKEYPLLFSTSNGEATGSSFSTKILYAAQSPSGSRYAIANSLNEIYICDYKPDGPSNPIRIKKASSKISSSAFRPGKLLLSFLQENILSVFWVKDEKLMLRTVQLNDNGEVISDYDLRADLERLMAERTPNASSRTQSPRIGVPSSPVVEKRGLSISLRPDLPELASN